MFVNRSKVKPISPAAAAAPAADRSLPVLLAELVELGREAWRISERERAVRAEIDTLREIEESQRPDHLAWEKRHDCSTRARPA